MHQVTGTMRFMVEQRPCVGLWSRHWWLRGPKFKATLRGRWRCYSLFREPEHSQERQLLVCALFTVLPCCRENSRYANLRAVSTLENGSQKGQFLAAMETANEGIRHYSLLIQLRILRFNTHKSVVRSGFSHLGGAGIDGLCFTRNILVCFLDY